jgi:hypothetical protein
VLSAESVSQHRRCEFVSVLICNERRISLEQKQETRERKAPGARLGWTVGCGLQSHTGVDTTPRPTGAAEQKVALKDKMRFTHARARAWDFIRIWASNDFIKIERLLTEKSYVVTNDHCEARYFRGS